MCGPPDFGALHTCVIRLAALSAAGLTTYSVCKTASLCRRIHRKREKQQGRVLQNLPGRLAAEGSCGHANT